VRAHSRVETQDGTLPRLSFNIKNGSVAADPEYIDLCYEHGIA
jgi:hypothetical protein